jgi:hypothetical protein
MGGRGIESRARALHGLTLRAAEASRECLCASSDEQHCVYHALAAAIRGLKEDVIYR